MVDPSIHITRATAADGDLLSYLSKKTFEDTFRGTCTGEDLQGFVDSAFSPATILQELKDENDSYFIAWHGNTVAGYMRLKEDYSEYHAIKKYNALELKRIYVLESYHGKKVGGALMQFAVNLATEKNFDTLWLGVWEHNVKARTFYRKWGFTETGDSHDFPIGNTPQLDLWLIKHLK